MAGTPKKRSQIEAAKAQAEAAAQLLEQIAPPPGAIPEALGDLGSSVRSPRLRSVPLSDAQLRTPRGVDTRRVVDSTAASEIARLASQLRPGLRVQIERTKPHWCAGIVETGYVVGHESARELVDHVRDEWGGATFRLTVLAPDGGVAFESMLSVCAPPRFEGRDIYRQSWGGEEAPPKRAREDNPPRPALVSSAAQVDPLAMFERAFQLSQQIMGASNERHLEAIRDMIGAEREKTRQLIDAVTARHGAEAQATQASAGGSLVDQLKQLIQAKKAIEQAGKVFEGPERERNPGDKPEDDDVMKGALKEAMKQFVGAAMMSSFAPRKAPMPGPNARTRVRAPARPSIIQNPAEIGEIPFAEETGQPPEG